MYTPLHHDSKFGLYLLYDLFTFNYLLIISKVNWYLILTGIHHDYKFGLCLLYDLFTFNYLLIISKVNWYLTH